MTVTMDNLLDDCMIATVDNWNQIMVRLMTSDEIAVDTETTGLDVHNGDDYLMGICLSVEGMSCYMPFRHPVGNLPKRFLVQVEDLLREKDLIWHNRKFDMHSLKTIGIDPLLFTGKQYDTLIIASLIDEEEFSKELDYLANKYLKLKKVGKEVHSLGKIFGYRNLNPEVYEDYGPVDAKLTRLLKGKLWPLLVFQNLDDVYWSTEEPFTRLLYKLEQRGVGTNLDFAETKATLGRGRMGTIKRELGGLNPSSPIELGKYLLTELELPVLAHTDSCDLCRAGMRVDTHEGNASFNKNVMEDYDEILSASTNNSARLIAEYRGWQKAVTSLYEPVLAKTQPDGKIRTNFRQDKTVTGRLSSANPNLQQIPRASPKIWNGNAKSTFHSGVSADYALYGWDYSQLELRLAAAYGNETILLTEFERPEADPFSVLAPLIFGVLTPETRFETKTFVYANLYGAGVAKIAAQLGRPIGEVEELYRNYKQSVSGIMEVSSQVASLVKQTGVVKYWDGRKRHMRNRSKAYKAWNSVCQGGGAQMVKKAMLKIEEFEDENCFMVLQVHDEITFAIRRDMIPVYEPMIVKAMTDFPQFGVIFAVEGKEWK